MDDAFEAARRSFFAGVAQHEAGRYAEAAASFEASLAQVPGRPSTLANLGASRLALGQAEGALAVLDAALAAVPDDSDAWTHRGLALALLGRQAEALANHDRALALDPARVADHFGRGNALALLGRHDEALAAFDATLEHAPDHAEAWSRRGGLLRDAGRLADAAVAYERALANGADPALNGYFLAAARGDTGPASPPRAYVEGLFDEYADGFGTHLVEALGYRAHARLAQGLAVVASAARFSAGLDLGCGSGLCGPELRPWVGVLDGVDLSARMLAAACELGVYRDLAHADLASHLERTERRYDLVAAADVFIYVGALDAVFAGVRRVLEPGGVFAFTVEKSDDDGAGGYRLLPSLRYAHSRPAIDALAAGHGFAIEHAFEAPLREDQRRPIAGLYLYLRRN